MNRHLGVFATAVLAGCGGGPAPQVQPQPLAMEQRVFYDENGGLRDSTTLEIRDRAALERAWQQITATRRTPPPLGDVPGLANVDFERSMLLVVAPGRLKRGDRLRIERVGRGIETDARGDNEDVLIVEFTIVQGCSTVDDPAYPVEIVRVARYNGTVRYRGTRSPAANCG